MGVVGGTIEPGVKLCKGSLEGPGRGVFQKVRQLLFREFRQMLVVRAPVVMPHQSIVYSVAPTASTTWSPTLVLAALSALW